MPKPAFTPDVPEPPLWSVAVLDNGEGRADSLQAAKRLASGWLTSTVADGDPNRDAWFQTWDELTRKYEVVQILSLLDMSS